MKAVIVVCKSPSHKRDHFCLNDPLDSEGRTALHYVTLRRRCDPEVIVERLLRAGAKVDTQDSNGMTALLYASSKTRDGSRNSAKVVQVLLNAGASVNGFQDNHQGMSPLHLACDNEDSESTLVVSQLLKAGANIKALDKTGSGPLHHVHSVGLAQMLMDAGAEMDLPNTAQGDTPLHCCLFVAQSDGIGFGYENDDECAQLDAPELAAFLIQKGADVVRPNKKGIRPLDCIQRVLQKNIEGGGTGYISSDLSQMVDFLTVVVPPMLKQLDDRKKDLSPSSFSESELMSAPTIGAKMMFRVVDEFTGDDGEDIMDHLAPLLEILGANVNFVNPTNNKKNFTILHLLLSPSDQVEEMDEEMGDYREDGAGMQGHILDAMNSVLETARQQGQQFDFSAKDVDGWTLLHVATQQGYHLVVERLLELAPFLLEERTTTTTEADDAGMQKTALHVAAMAKAENQGDEEQNDNDPSLVTLDTLLRLGANVNATTGGAAHSYTALHLACQYSRGSCMIAKLLEASRGVWNATDTSGKTALHHVAAREQDVYECMELILKFFKSMVVGNQHAELLANEVNRCDKNGQTPLHIVCMNRSSKLTTGMDKVVALLLDKHQADPLIADKYGMRSIEWALLARKNFSDCPNLVYTLLSRQQAWGGGSTTRSNPPANTDLDTGTAEKKAKSSA